MSNTLHVVLDLEALSMQPYGAIISIGAAFVQNSIIIGEFYEIVDPTTYNKQPHIDLNTVAWWMQQSDETKREFFDVNTGRWAGTSVTIALLRLNNKIYKLCPESYNNYDPDLLKIWGWPAASDCLVLRNSYELSNNICPWQWRQEYCLRTLYRMVPGVKREKPITAHNALSDAIAQANTLINCLKKLDNG